MENNKLNQNNDEFLIEESDESNVPITVPFDPNLIRIRRDPFTLGQVIDKIEHDEINFFTLFQRRDNLWDSIKQSRLIESVLLKLPLPAFYFDELVQENEKTKEKIYLWQVIDGLQRCSVLRNFVVDKNMSLDRLEFLNQFNNYKYDQLPRELQRRIIQTPITVYVVEKGTPEEVKFNIFKRINTGGLILTPQEIRHALNQGIPAIFIAELAESKSFKKATSNIIKSNRMEDRDFVTRFVSFYLKPYTEYEPDLDSFMTKGMGSLKNLTQNKLNQIKEDFDKAMKLSISIFGNDAFRKRLNKDDTRRPLNKALFESISVAFSKLTESEAQILIKRKDEFKMHYILLNHDTKFYQSLASGTGQKDNVIKRFSEIEQLVKETISLKE
jgi:hypothetical protein